MRLGFLRSYFSGFVTSDIAIDLGTATTLIYVKGKGIVLNEPSVVALDKRDGIPVAIGAEAKVMLGRTPDTMAAVRPMKDGVIADFEIVEEMLKGFIDKVQKKRTLVRPRIVVSVPSGITAVEMRAVRDSVEHAGAREVYLVAEPIAAAVGIGLAVEDPTGNMVIDIGGGTTEIAVIALSGIVSNSSIRIAGDEMDEAIIQYIKKKYNLLIGEQTAERVKIQIGSAYPLASEERMDVKGIDLVNGIPKVITVTSEEIREALSETLGMIVEALRLALEKTPPELASDILDNGVVMSGGGALLRGLDRLFQEDTDLPVRVVDNPIECVVYGTGRILDDLSRYEKLLITLKRE
ncbi:rod shape-determining protein MreB [candidate division TA06 bacterium DG_26]|uniref:Cell shape-determining protein MreB n=1 Tax=candidate division TA06 bacterium DG_26 TaxID=1703771 RepID=A0A0S7WMC2_UNCT6|nr:MAG: rod shape-determining protein MreB [candidate division TA06 bacterium DG_26]